MEILTYHILTASSADALAGNLQSAIKSGWQPFGSLQITGLKDGGVTYAQAMVQYLHKAA